MQAMLPGLESRLPMFWRTELNCEPDGSRFAMRLRLPSAPRFAEIAKGMGPPKGSFAALVVVMFGWI